VIIRILGNLNNIKKKMCIILGLLTFSDCESIGTPNTKETTPQNSYVTSSTDTMTTVTPTTVSPSTNGLEGTDCFEIYN